MRTIGFNPQLVMNDGLLVQSYMQAYNTDFPDATRKIEKTVSLMKDELYQRGQITLNNVGTLYYNMNGIYEFAPLQTGFFTPSLYGLEPFVPSPLQELTETVTRQTYRPEPVKEIVPQTADPQTPVRVIPIRKWLKNAVAVAAAVILFFILSVPVENTYVSEANYASLDSYSLFDAIRNQSAASSITTEPQNNTRHRSQAKNNVNTLRPASVRTEKVAPAKKKIQPKKEKPHTATTQPAPVSKAEPKKQTAAPRPEAPQAASRKGCYVIVASLPNAADAQREAQRLQGKGFKDAEVVESQGRYRISVARYAQASDAYKKIQDLKKTAGFESAWVYTVK